MFNSFYQGKRVLVTGHTGFKGGWLSLWLKELDARVMGLSLATIDSPNLYEIIHSHVFSEEIECDIRDFERLKSSLLRLQPEIIFHLAAQPIVRRSYDAPLETFTTNALGTAHLLEAVRSIKLNCVLLVITSDKCYANREWEFAYRENDPLGGDDVYSMSKAATELVTHAWNSSFFRTDSDMGPVATARAGNVIGGGDYGQDRIIPDSVRSLSNKAPIVIRNPGAIRPWQHVLECLSGYLWLAAQLGEQPDSKRLAGSFNFGPELSARHTVRCLVDEFLKTWPGRWVDGSDPNSMHEATLLSLSAEKASLLLDWYPSWNFEEAVRRTAEWYHRRHVANDSKLLEFSLEQISAYVQAAKQKGLAWVRTV